jgi:hypothetical protein
MEIKQKVPFTVKQLSLETPQVIKENEEVDFHIHHNKIQWF